MFKNYFKTAWRSLVKNKAYSALNILGLATGMAVALMIGLWVYYQFSYDRFLPGYEQVYSVKLKTNDNGIINVNEVTPFPLADAIKQNVPGVKYVSQPNWIDGHLLMNGDKKIFQSGAIEGSDFLDMFQYSLLKGNSNIALQDAYSIVLTESTAKALFGKEDAMNKTVRFDNSHDLKVTGILKDIPANSTLQFNYIIPFGYALQNYSWINEGRTNWRSNSCQTFVALQPHVSYAQVEEQIRYLERKYNPEDYRVNKVELVMQPLKDWHLYADYRNGIAGGFIDYVKMFSIIGLLVLIIACINFMNLSTARSEKRAREVGIRKAIGSRRNSLIYQFLTEAIVVTGIAALIALLIVWIALPAFNILTKSNISIPYSNIFFWLIIIGYVLITGLLAGSRPAFYLSSFKPVKVLKGTFQTGKSASLPRKVLVVLQFSCSIALIISTIIVYQQIEYAKERPAGYNANLLVSTDLSGSLEQNYEALKNEMLQSGVVTSVTKSSSPVTDIWANQRIDNWEGKLPGESLELSTVGVSDADYFKTMGMQIISGRNFTGSLGADSLTVLLNEAAVKRMRYKQPLNQIITWHDVPQHVKVIGIVKDAVMASPFAEAQPTIFPYTPGWSNVITYRLSSAVNTQQVIGKLTEIFNKYNPAYPYQYHFTDESYAAKFDFQTLLGKLAGLFAALAIFISCLGLFGLAAYMAEQRTKEIGIRKVLGASVAQVWLLLSKEFIVLVLISCVIASPVAFYYLHNWLQQYDYRITISPFVFVIAGIAAVLITIITISFQAIKAAVANPVKSLRTE
ncbi:MAG TPA: ABC transporter permease [Parafilimonas sp.]|nr:ABC transporter permease [Parafilimonas sp.]